jgi:ABC-type multidrug transport system fused ATPase/permease subunit
MPAMTALAESVGDAAVITRRNLRKILRVPDVLVFTTLSPIMFVLLFAYVFGGAIGAQDTGVDYREYLIAGVFVQTVVFGATFTGYSLAEDLQKGIVDRFRSLPMSTSSVVVGRTVSDIGINVVSLFVMSLTGLVVGWRIRSSVLEAVAAYLLIRVFARGRGAGGRAAVDDTEGQPRSPASISASAAARSTVGDHPQPWARSARMRPVHAGPLSQTGSTPTAAATVS